MRRKIRDDVESGAQKQQREYFLRKQMESIRKELGEDEGDLIAEYEQQDRRGRACPRRSPSRPRSELRRLERQGEQSPECSMIRSYLDWLIAVPWSKRSEERLDPDHTRAVLDEDHAGPRGREAAHHRVHRGAQAARGARRSRRTSRANGAILTLVGPPGTGKTSIGESVARALGREFVRISLGGIRDEAEIRGHRRTYIGALPGRIVRALRDAGTMNPVILLDEVDKVGADWRGDPSAALLEVLDPAQNHSFRDHYLDVELDLSEVVFIATANLADTIPAPLLDRMEVDRLRRLHDRGEARDRPRLPVAAPAGAKRPSRRGGRGLRRDPASGDHRVHARGRRAPARARDRKAAAGGGTQIASGEAEAPIVIDPDAVPTPSGARSSSRSRWSGRRSPACPRAWP